MKVFLRNWFLIFISPGDLFFKLDNIGFAAGGINSFCPSDAIWHKPWSTKVQVPDSTKPLGYAPVIRLKMAISGWHAHIYANKMDVFR